MGAPDRAEAEREAVDMMSRNRLPEADALGDDGVPALLVGNHALGTLVTCAKGIKRSRSSLPSVPIFDLISFLANLDKRKHCMER